MSAALEPHWDPRQPGFTIINGPFGASTDVVAFNQPAPSHTSGWPR